MRIFFAFILAAAALAVFLVIKDTRRPANYVEACSPDGKIRAYLAAQKFVERQFTVPVKFPNSSDSNVLINYVGNCTFHVRGVVEAIRPRFFTVDLSFAADRNQWIADSVVVQ